jgi:ACS family hexuronate transporter-like MFS transporter
MAWKWGWQSAFIAAGIAGFLWLFLWMPFYNTPDKIGKLTPAERAHIHSDVDEKGDHDAGKVSWFRLLGYRQTWSFVVGKFLTDPVWWFFLSWLPDYFKKTRGLDIKNSAILLVSIYTVITVLSIIGGWFTGYLTRRGWSVTRARKTGMFMFACAVLPILAVTKVGDWPAVMLIGLAGAAHQAWSANLFTTVSDMFPKHLVASVVGLGGMSGAVGGIFFQKFTGRLLDHFTALNDVTKGYVILFAICAFAYLVTFAIHHLLAPRLEPFLRNNEKPA